MVFPSIYYAFLDPKNIFVQNNFKSSNAIASGSVNNFHDPNFISAYQNGEIVWIPEPEYGSKSFGAFIESALRYFYGSERDAELIRSMYYKSNPSRFSAVYGFGDYNTCEVVAQKYNWDINTVKMFRINEHPLNRITKANMEIVSYLRGIYAGQNGSLLTDDKIVNAWKAYWDGAAWPGAEIGEAPGEPIWEYLIDGVLYLAE
ncbi:MAG TPA: hypothetical protein PKA10_19790 [Selenomonadales bacterium]|nr:hypothetical protein [Selenomonadales bacterium]